MVQTLSHDVAQPQRSEGTPSNGPSPHPQPGDKRRRPVRDGLIVLVVLLTIAFLAGLPEWVLPLCAWAAVAVWAVREAQKEAER